MVCHWWAGIL